jgi:hypothetical protein
VTPSNFELLDIQAEDAFDDRHRISGWYGVTMALSVESAGVNGGALWFGAQVPDALETELAAVLEQAPPPHDPSRPPIALDSCRRLLQTGGRSVSLKGGPSYLIEQLPPPDPSFRIERSDTPPATLRDANPGNWEPVEWTELLDGQLGPWTMALDGHRVVSICHTPGPVTARAAECGVWTDPAFRGRGYAAATTAAWAALLRPSGRHLFYSTDADNRSSQNVARRLGLRLIGWKWSLGEHGASSRVHPLCSLRLRTAQSVWKV